MNQNTHFKVLIYSCTHSVLTVWILEFLTVILYSGYETERIPKSLPILLRMWASEQVQICEISPAALRRVLGASGSARNGEISPAAPFLSSIEHNIILSTEVVCLLRLQQALSAPAYYPAAPSTTYLFWNVLKCPKILSKSVLKCPKILPFLS